MDIILAFVQFWKDVLYAWKFVIDNDENKDWTTFLPIQFG
jgi:hypothetical protein